MRARFGAVLTAALLMAAVVVVDASPASAVELDFIVTGAGPGGGPHVKVWNAGGDPTNNEWMAYDPAFRGGIDVAMADIDGDGTYEIVTAPQKPGGPHVKVFDIDGTLLNEFMAYAPAFTGGVNLGAADVDGDGDQEILTGPGPGGGPHVKAFDISETDVVSEDLSFMAGSGTSKGGADVTGFYPDDTSLVQHIAVADGPGGPGFVRTYTNEGTLRASFQPYPGFGGGARIASADIDNDGRGELVTGAGPGGGPHVKTFTSGSTQVPAGVLISGMSFFAYASGFRGGVDVGSFFESPSAANESVVTGAGPGGGPHVRTWNPPNHTNGSADFQAYPGFTGGIRVTGGFVNIGE